MKTFKIIITIDHTDRNYQSDEIQDFIKQINTPEANFKKSLKKAFKDTILGKKAENINITWGEVVCGN